MKKPRGGDTPGAVTQRRRVPMSAVKVHRIDRGVNDLSLSAVVGVGADAHRIATIGAWSFMVPENNQEPMIRDLDAA
jgi:hypothetical protein